MVDLAALGGIIAPILPAILGPVASAAANAAEKLPVVPYEGKSIATIVLAVFLASLAICVVVAGATGRLAGDWQSLLRILIEAIATTLAGCGAYSLAQARKPLV
jgi:cytochrome c biogenesis protein CcdA